MTDTLNAIPANAPHVRPLGQRTAADILNLQDAAQNGQTGIVMSWSYPGVVAPIGVTVAWPLPRNYANGYVYQVTAAISVIDSGNDMTLGYWYNGVRFTQLVIPAGQTLAIGNTPSTGAWPIAASLTNIFQVSLDVYGGSTASNLTWHIYAF